MASLGNLTEGFFELLINLVSERYNKEVSNLTDKDIVQYQVINHLCLSSLTHSELYTKLYNIQVYRFNF